MLLTAQTGRYIDVIRVVDQDVGLQIQLVGAFRDVPAHVLALNLDCTGTDASWHQEEGGQRSRQGQHQLRQAELTGCDLCADLCLTDHDDQQFNLAQPVLQTCKQRQLIRTAALWYILAAIKCTILRQSLRAAMPDPQDGGQRAGTACGLHARCVSGHTRLTTRSLVRRGRNLESAHKAAVRHLCVAAFSMGYQDAESCSSLEMMRSMQSGRAYRSMLLCVLKSSMQLWLRDMRPSSMRAYTHEMEIELQGLAIQGYKCQKR